MRIKASTASRLAATCLTSLSFVVCLASPAMADQTSTTNTSINTTVTTNDDLVVIAVTAPKIGVNDVKIQPVIAAASKSDVAALNATNMPVVTAPVITAPSSSTQTTRSTPVVAAPQIGSSRTSDSEAVAPVFVTPAAPAENPVEEADPQLAASTDSTGTTVITESAPQLALSVPTGPGAVWTYALFILFGLIAGWMVHRGRNRHTV